LLKNPETLARVPALLAFFSKGGIFDFFSFFPGKRKFSPLCEPTPNRLGAAHSPLSNRHVPPNGDTFSRWRVFALDKTQQNDIKHRFS